MSKKINKLLNLKANLYKVHVPFNQNIDEIQSVVALTEYFH
jgi:hypothetical protein